MIYHASICRLDSDVIDFVAVFDECESWMTWKHFINAPKIFCDACDEKFTT